MLTHAELLRASIDIIESFNPKKTTVDAHFADSLDTEHLSPAEIKFIQQVLYGCARYTKLLKIFVHSFLYKNPAIAPWSDQTVYLILGYLLLFRLEELGLDEFRQFILGGLSTPSALNALLIFCLSEDDLNEWCKEAWCKVYDVAFIEEELIGKLHSYRTEMAPLLNEIAFIATGSGSSAVEAEADTVVATGSKRKVTVQKPFNLTKPKPRLIPPPVAIDRVIEAQPVPKTIYETTLSSIDEQNEKRREELREKIASKYSKEQEFKLTTAERPGADDRVRDRFRDEMERVEMEECTFAPKINPAYNPKGIADTEVKYNTAAILREDKLVRNKQEKEYELLKNYESELQDASEFYRWQQDMREKDTVNEEMRVAQRKVEMQMARTEAIEASASQVRRNHAVAQHERAEITVALEKQAQQREVILENKKDLVSVVIQERGLARVAEKNVLDEKELVGIEVRKISKEKAKRKKTEDAHEMERRKDLIRQIRACERVVAKVVIPFDPNEPPRHGVMEEMCIAELRKRLQIVREAAKYEVEKRHEDILAKKDEKKIEIEGKLTNIKHIRNLAQTDAQMRREKLKAKKAEEEKQKEAIKQQRFVEVTAKIDAKKRARAEEEKRLKQELKEISTKRQFDDLKTGKDASTLLQEELQRGLERTARMLAEKEELMKLGEKVSRNRDTKIRQENYAEKRREYKKMQHEVEERLEASQKEYAIKKDRVRREKKEGFDKQKKFEAEQKIARDKAEPYAGKMRLLTIEDGRDYRLRRSLSPKELRGMSRPVSKGIVGVGE